MKHPVRKLMPALLTAVMLGSTAVPVRAEEDFDAFLEQEWREQMEASYIDMHFSVKDREAMGLEKPEVTFGETGYEGFDALDRLNALTNVPIPKNLDSLRALDEIHKDVVDVDSIPDYAEA